MGKGADGSQQKKPELAQEDQWIATLDLKGFKQEVKDIGETLLKNQGQADVDHLNKIILWANICATVGLLTLWMSPNPVTIIALSTWCCARWTMIGHHVCHGGYDKVETGGRFNRWKFAVGGLYQRLFDWFDWFLPEAWNVEHNNMHHYSLGEIDDPDLVENNLIDLRSGTAPLFAKYVQVCITACIWKWFYYAPNTYKEYKMALLRRQGKPTPEGFNPEEAVTLISLFLKGSHPCHKLYTPIDFIMNVVGPYLIIHFLAIPAPLLLLDDRTYFYNAMVNLVLAEILTNIHSFIIIVTNHAGDDMYRFQGGVTPKSGTFFLRQVISSVNFTTGGDFNDFLHGWLNYQIEHHLWPNLSMLSYQKAQPLVKALCEKHNIPYIQHSVFWRVHKTAQIMVGTNSMRPYPTAYDVAEDMPKTDRGAVKTEGGVTY